MHAVTFYLRDQMDRVIAESGPYPFLAPPTKPALIAISRDLAKKWKPLLRGKPGSISFKHGARSALKQNPRRASRRSARSPFAICHAATGPAKTKKFKRCVRKVSRRNPLTAEKIEQLRSGYQPIERLSDADIEKLRAVVNKGPDEILHQLASQKPPIKWLTYFAKSELVRRHPEIHPSRRNPYVPVKPGQIIQQGDEYLSKYDRKWYPSGSVGRPAGIPRETSSKYRRFITGKKTNKR